MSNKNKCRACLTEGAKYPIFVNIESDESIYSKLYQCLNEYIEDKEGYPNKICESCKTILDTVHNFINKFKMTCKILENGIIVKQEMDIDNEPNQQIEIEIVKVEPESDSDGPDPLEDDWKEKPEQNDKESPNTQINKREKRLLEIRAKLEALKQSKLNKAASTSTSKTKTKATGVKAKPSAKRLNSVKAKKIKEETSKQCKSESKESEIPTEILCDLCGEVFDCLTKLTKHRDQAHFPMKCSLCPKVLASEYYLKCHMKRVHTEDKPFICESCGRGFIFPGELATHNRVVHLRLIKPKTRPVCPKCNRSFSNKKTLLIHDRSAHTGLRPAVCKECGASFFHEDYLKLHVRLHTGETPHKCPICGKGFAQSGNMKSHISHNHSLADLSPETVKTLKPRYLKFLKKP